MIIHLQKWGNSLGIRIPSMMVKELGLHSGEQLDLILQDHQLIIKPRKNKLDEMLSMMDDASTIHEEFFQSDDSIGKEAW